MWTLPTGVPGAALGDEVTLRPLLRATTTWELLCISATGVGSGAEKKSAITAAWDRNLYHTLYRVKSLEVVTLKVYMKQREKGESIDKVRSNLSLQT